MAIALRHFYNLESFADNEVNQTYFPDAIKNKLELNRQAASAVIGQQQVDAPTAQRFDAKDLPGDVKPIWIGDPNAQAIRVSLQPLQEWEGYVVELAGDNFTAKLVDRTAGQSSEEEIAEFPIADLSENDRKLLRPGAVFRWVIGYQRSIGGQRRRVSQLVFRRMPSWSRRDLSRAKARAKDLIDNINWE
ncbi:hypothetical protein [Methylobacterium sp. E-046]|uniref:hypothetical protein n=1 Tax=Methylobacterium sp. E-046 TaxID=2836576 RepID=UPI001FBB018B|nr:hypothetical protein [Methylobacterium sp. E-046]MCJ2102701.1 hypothetical protein [Methylobacterium sp. E-046]